MSWNEAWAAGGWIAGTGAAALLALVVFLPGMVVWLVPVFLPMVLAMPIITLSSRPLAPPLFSVPNEAAPTEVIGISDAIRTSWEATDAAERALGMGAPVSG